MKTTSIAMVLLLGFLLVSGLACNGEGDGVLEPTHVPLNTATPTTPSAIQSITIRPDSVDGKDAWFSSEAPNTKYQDSSSLFAGVTINGVSVARSYLQFEFYDVPPTAVVTQAKLGLYHLSSELDIIAVDIGVYRVNSSWSESDIYWYNHPDCAFTAEDIIALPATATHQYEYWDISGLVQGWIDGSITNYGACVKDANENTWDGRRHFASSDISIIDYRPILVISYYDPTAP